MRMMVRMIMRMMMRMEEEIERGRGPFYTEDWGL